MRRVRKITTYVCTSCFKMFPSSKEAKAHASTHPAPAKPTAQRRRRGPTQTGAILDAVKGGATSAAAISKKTKIPLERVHSLLSYHRRRGNIKGFSGTLKASR
jgi:hypothetical protein